MKKVFLLFTIFTLAATLPLFAQEQAVADSVKLPVLAAVDSSAAVAELSTVVSAPRAKRRYSLAKNLRLTTGIYQIPVATADTSKQPFISTPDYVLQASLVEKIAVNVTELEDHFSAIASDTLRARIPQKMPSTVTALKRQIPLITNDTLRAAYYQNIANHYLKYDSITIRRTKQYYQDAAIEFTMKALHSYSRYSSAEGLVTSYNNLSKVYRDQKKYPQAKWFILQSNTISRNLNDVPNIITSLVALAYIKMDIKDYSLAMRDLNEALTLSAKSNFPKQESDIQQSFALLYTHLNNPKKAALALKRRDAIADSLIKAAEAQRLAVYKSQDSTLQAKKKLYTSVSSVSKKSSKISSSKKTVSL
jgi:tetratricopeptide (TPR) repeat protein